MRFCLFLSVIASSLLGWIAFMAADNQPPYEYDVENSYIIPYYAKDGSQITVRWRLKNVNRICPGSNRRVLFDPITKVVIATYDPTPAALSDSVKDGYLNRTFLLPQSLPEGRTGYRATVCYECNPFQKYVRALCITTPDIFFNVVHPKEG